jgi:hypothetical protein
MFAEPDIEVDVGLGDTYSPIIWRALRPISHGRRHRRSVPRRSERRGQGVGHAEAAVWPLMTAPISIARSLRSSGSLMRLSMQ